MLKMSHVLGAIAVFTAAAAVPTAASARELSTLVGPAMRVAAGLNESSSLLLLGSVLAGLAYIIDGRQGRS